MAGRILIVASVVLISALYAGCDSSDVVTRPEQIVFPETNVSYGRQVQPLFDLTCNTSGCHNASNRAGDVVLTTYINLFSKPGLVLAGDSLHSVLGQIIRGQLPHITIPISALINENQQHGINVWIAEGASNN